MAFSLHLPSKHCPKKIGALQESRTQDSAQALSTHPAQSLFVDTFVGGFVGNFMGQFVGTFVETFVDISVCTGAGLFFFVGFFVASLAILRGAFRGYKNRLFCKFLNFRGPFRGALVSLSVSTESPTRGTFRGHFRGAMDTSSKTNPSSFFLCASTPPTPLIQTCGGPQQASFLAMTTEKMTSFLPRRDPSLAR